MVVVCVSVVRGSRSEVRGFGGFEGGGSRHHGEVEVHDDVDKGVCEQAEEAARDHVKPRHPGNTRGRRVVVELEPEPDSEGVPVAG